MDRLKLIALDAADLEVISACLQDAVFKTGDMEFAKSGGHFTIQANRFAWEKDGGRKRRNWERRRSVLAVKRVGAVRSLGIDRSDKDAVHDLLALRFMPEGEGPQGQIELVLAGGASIILSVECIEIQLADAGGAWGTGSKPRHDLGG